MASKTEGASNRRQPVLIGVLVVVSVVAFGWWFGDDIWLAYHFRGAIDKDLNDSAVLPEYASNHVWAIGMTGQRGETYLYQKARTGNYKERATAIRCLILLGVRGISQAAAWVIENEPRPARDVSETSVLQVMLTHALCRVPSPETTRALKLLARQSDNPLVFILALDGLRRRRCDDIDAIMAAALAREGVRGQAMRAVRMATWGHRPGEKTMRMLEQIAATSPRPQRVERARELLARMKEKDKK